MSPIYQSILNKVFCIIAGNLSRTLLNEALHVVDILEGVAHETKNPFDDLLISLLRSALQALSAGEKCTLT
jgi:hypothetical protein